MYIYICVCVCVCVSLGAKGIISHTYNASGSRNFPRCRKLYHLQLYAIQQP